MTIRCHLLESHPLPEWFQLIPSCREHMTSQYDRMCSLKCDACYYANSCNRTARFLSFGGWGGDHTPCSNKFIYRCFRKILPKATINIVVSPRPPTSGRIFTKFDIWELLEKSVDRIQVPLNSDKEYVKIYMHVLPYHAHFFLEWKMFRTKCVEKFKTHILCPVTLFFRKSCRLWDNMEK